MKVLFVCSGNTCRSPLAVAAWRRACGEMPGLEQIEVDSAGICPEENAPAAPHSLTIAAQWGQDLSEHRAKMFDATHTHSDLIVTMTRDQAEILRAHFGLDENRVRVLGSWVPRRTKREIKAQLQPLWGSDGAKMSSPHDDILDPHGGSFEAYADCAAQIERAVRELAKVLSSSQRLGNG